MMRTLHVTVSVDTDDIVAVLAFYTEGSAAVHNRHTRQLITTYHNHDIDPVRREEFWTRLPASLRYCIHEVEMGRAGALRALLEESGAGDA